MTDTATVIRVAKEDGTRSTVDRGQALANLAANHSVADVAPMLDAATEAHPAQTPFALYWPLATAERSAGEAVADAVATFIHRMVPDTILVASAHRAELATAIDDALRVYR